MQTINLDDYQQNWVDKKIEDGYSYASLVFLPNGSSVVWCATTDREMAYKDSKIAYEKWSEMLECDFEVGIINLNTMEEE